MQHRPTSIPWPGDSLCARATRPLRVLGLLLGMMGLLVSAVRANLPEPGLIYYGRVFNNGSLVTGGQLKWTLTPAGGGAAVVITTALGTISNGFGETWSYIVEFPATFSVAGGSLPANTLGLTASDANYNRAATLNGAALTLANSAPGSVALSSAKRGAIERVDLIVSGQAPNDGIPPGAPILIGPGDGQQGLAPNTILFDWLGGSDTTGYEILLWREGDPQPGSPNLTGIGGTDFALFFPLLQQTRYFWQVVAVGPGGRTPSPRWSFTTFAVNAGPSVQFTAARYSVNEHQSPARLMVQLNNGGATSVTAQFRTEAIGSAQENVNFVPQAGTLSLTGALSQREVNIGILSDGKPRDEKVFRVSLYNLINAQTGTPTTAEVQIIDESIGSIFDYLLGKSANAVGLDRNNDTRIDIADVTFQTASFPPLAPAQPSPFNGAQNIGLRPPLTWSRTSARDRGYDLYLWPAGQNRPATPTLANLSGPTAVAPDVLQYGTVYNWQVEARGEFENTGGPVWNFTTIPAPPVQLIAPNSGTYAVGGTLPVHWKTRPDGGTAVRIELWRNNQKVAVLGNGYSDTNETTTNVIIPTVAPANDYQLRVYSIWLESQNAPVIYIESFGTFVITAS